MRLELRHLRILCAIADAGSLSQAASAAGFSQPALTAQLHRIEAALGGKVFHRGPRGVTPTQFGLFVLNRARSVLVTMDDLIAARPETHDASLIRVGGYTTPVLTGLVRRLFECHGLQITVHTEYSPRLLLDLLASGRLDLIALVDYPHHRLPAVPDITTRFIATEPIFVIMPRDHQLANQSEVPLADLAGEDWLVTPPDGAGWPEIFYAACQDAGFAPRIRHMMSERDTIRTLVA
jgi:DNA-binding transcriptional LysR family regulator